MNLKQKKFCVINNLISNFNKFEKNICLFVHTSNLNTWESNQFKLYCDSTKVKTNYVKISLLKKLTKNNILINLLAGPTRLLFFNNFEIFLEFFTNLPLKKKIYPLTILFNNKFYNYLYFYDNLKIIKANLNNSLVNLDNVQKKIIFSLNKFKEPILLNIYMLLNNFIMYLPNYFKKFF